MARNYTEVIEARAKELEKQRGVYQLAQAEAAVLGAESQQKRLLSLYQLTTFYRAGEPMEKAVYLLAQMSMMLTDMVSPLLTIRDYVAKEADIEKLRAGMAPEVRDQ